LAFIQQEKEIEWAYRMTHQLLRLMKNKHGDTATAWVRSYSWCGIAELEAFAPGLQKAVPAFQAACSLPSHNGMAQGCVNTLKPLKGSMDGWGSVAFVRQRVLQSAASLSTTRAGEPVL
jgi:transposase